MLNPFPDLLTYGFFAPTLLRVAAGCVWAYMAYHTWRHHKQIAHEKLPVYGRQPWAGGAGALIEFLVAALLFAGAYTQWLAILGLLGVLKYFLLRRWWPHLVALFFPATPMTMLLFAAVSLSLLLTGAGALAIDLPL